MFARVVQREILLAHLGVSFFFYNAAVPLVLVNMAGHFLPSLHFLQHFLKVNSENAFAVAFERL